MPCRFRLGIYAHKIPLIFGFVKLRTIDDPQAALSTANGIFKHTNMLKKLQAQGRLKAGQMNKTEARYAAHLETLKRAGEIVYYQFESVKLKIADGTYWYCPDFMVMRPDGQIEFHEVKGSPRIFADDAKVKVKVASTQFPFQVYVAYPDRLACGGWRTEEY